MSKDVSDLLGLEIEEVETQHQQTPVLPEKFTGKSAEDIAKAYSDLEKEKSRLANELGDLRKKVDEALFQKPQPQESTVEGVQIDELWDDPTAAIAKHPKVRQLEERIDGMDRQASWAKFTSKYPSYADEVTSDEFMSWVRRSPSRVGLYNQANQYNGDAALDLMGMWDEVQQRGQDTDEEQRAATLETKRSGGGGRSKKIYKRSAIIDLKVRDPHKYAELLPDIMQAYKEGRVK